MNELRRLEVALAGTEKMWREERQKVRALRLLRGAERLRWMGWGFLAGVVLALIW